MKPWITHGRARTPDGQDMVLAERDGMFLLRVNNVELMTTRQSESEIKLAELGCAALAQRADAKVLVGGLGFAFTLREVLQRIPSTGSVLVAELLPAIVEWNRNPAFPLGHRELADKRVRVETRDVALVIAANPATFDAILLDVDNGPAALTVERNEGLYHAKGLERIARALRPGGTLAVWSVDEAPLFVKTLQRAGFKTEVHASRAHKTSGGQRWIYLARRD